MTISNAQSPQVEITSNPHAFNGLGHYSASEEIDRSSTPNGLRFVEVIDDHMEPTIHKRDYVLLASTSRWMGEGYYLLRNCFGDTQSYDCSVVGTRKEPMILLHCHNKHYSADRVTLAYFEEHVAGKVAMICHVLHPSLLPQTMEW